MIASLYGSIEVLNYILKHVSTYGGNINQASISDGYTALHCAAASGSIYVMDTVTLLLSHGADPTLVDAQGLLPSQMIVVSPKLPQLRIAIEKLLNDFGSPPASGLSTPLHEFDGFETALPDFDEKMDLKLGDSSASFDLFSSSPTASNFSPFSSSDCSSPNSLVASSMKPFNGATGKIRDYPHDALLPDIKHSSYTSDEFRMFSFKVRPCSRAYSHDWTECPFAHPGENARRRDPRKYHYSCVPCPEFRKGTCRRGDACEYAHGVFECWLHPAQYRTRLCKDGTSCTRRVCFFAHASEELRPLYASTGSALPSPRTSSSPDMNSMSPPLGSGSPPILMAPNFSQLNSSQSAAISTPPISPSSVSSLNSSWSQSGVPTLHLPSVGLQTSRLRTSLSGKEALFEDLSRPPPGFGGQFMNEMASLATQARLNAAVAASGCNTASIKAGKCRNLGQAVTPTNFEDLFAAEVITSPRSPSREDYQSQVITPMQSHKPAHVFSRVQRQMQSQTGCQAFSPSCKQIQRQGSLPDSNVQGQLLRQSVARSSSLNLGSLSHTSETCKMFPLSSTGASSSRAILAEQAKRSHSSKILGAGLSCSDWGSPTGKAEWGINGDDLSELRKSAYFGSKVMDEPDLSWVHKLIKDGPMDCDSPSNVRSLDMPCNGSMDTVDHSVLRSWLEQIQLNQIAA